MTELSGLRYFKLDLHIHTPASHDFEDSDVTPEDIIAEAKSKGLDGIAITDHNCADWIDRVKDAAKDQDITVFPGVEITCHGGKNGIHMIALFDPSKNGSHVKSLLHDLKIKDEDQGEEDAIVHREYSLSKVVDTIQSETWQGIAVPAHVNSSKGIMTDMRATQRTDFVKNSDIIAVEATDFHKQPGKRTIDILDGEDPNYQRKLAVYQSSDNPCDDGSGHCLSGIGSRSTYFKLEKNSEGLFTLDGLRQCFLDPDVRIVPDFEYEPRQYPYISEIRISDGGGFLAGQTVKLHQGLNSILGAKGAGKSLLIELLRFALGQEPQHPNILRDHQSKLEERFGDYSSVEVDFKDETGKEFTVRREYRPTDNSPFDTAYDPSQVMPVLFLSQNEIIRIAEEEEYQLKFIDSFFDFQSFKRKISDIEERLESLDHRMAVGIRALPKIKDAAQRRSSLRIELESIDKQLKDPIFQEYGQMQEKTQTFENQKQHIRTIEDKLKTFDQYLSEVNPPTIPSDLRRDSALRRVQETLNEFQTNVLQQMESIRQELRQRIESLEEEINSYQAYRSQVQERYQQHIQSAGGDYRALASKRERVVKQLDDINKQLRDLESQRDGLRRIQQQRDLLLDDLENTYSEYTSSRKNRCEEFQRDSRGKLRLTIMDSSNVDEFKKQLLELKQGSYLREEEIEAITQNVKPREFIIKLLRYSAALSTERGESEEFLREISERAQISLDRMTKLADFLTGAIEPEHLLSLQHRAVPQDRPKIEYNIGNDVFQPLSSVSIGQKSTALLIMALSDGTKPVVIDQPEDSLDIRSIWEDICSKLRSGIPNRQFIFTTHNSSIAVASDTDNFVIMESSAANGQVVYSGSMDNSPVSDEVLKYLEGGIQTYKRKYLKYRIDKTID